MKKGNAILGKEIHHLWGKKTLTSSLCGLAFEVSPFSFFQVHKPQAELLYEKPSPMPTSTAERP